MMRGTMSSTGYDAQQQKELKRSGGGGCGVLVEPRHIYMNEERKSSPEPEAGSWATDIDKDGRQHATEATHKEE